jgi:Purine catabolism regulatory protein-like family/PucR C-terminal helix-turn-helix domain/GGDEF-like domain
MGLVNPAVLQSDPRFGDAELMLGDLFGDEQLGLEIVVAPEGWERRVVTGAHSIEIDHPARWLDRDWVMLSTGVHLSPDPGDQCQLIDELADAGVAALGFGLDIVHHQIPAALIEQARARSFPVFTIPHRTPFRDLVGLVYGATLSNEIRAANRLAAMQRFLMDSLGEESPRETVVQRLSGLIDSAVGILAAHGEVMLSSKELPGPEIFAEIGKHPGATVHFELEHVHGLAFPIAPDSADVRWLVIGSPAGKPLHPLAKAAGQTTVPLLAAMARLERVQESENAAVRRATLEALLDLEDKRDGALAAARAAASGLNIAQGATVIVIEDTAPDADLDALIAAISASLNIAQIPAMTTVRDGRVVLLAAHRARKESAAERIVSLRPTLWLGVGRRVTEPLAVHQSYADALLAVRVRTRGTPQSGNVIQYDDLDVGTVLVHEVPLERLAPKIERWLAPLRENPLAHEALIAYLRYDLDVGRTARALHLHPNSVRYRLARAEELLGVHLRSSETIVALHVALLAADTEPR